MSVSFSEDAAFCVGTVLVDKETVFYSSILTATGEVKFVRVSHISQITVTSMVVSAIISRPVDPTNSDPTLTRFHDKKVEPPRGHKPPEGDDPSKEDS